MEGITRWKKGALRSNWGEPVSTPYFFLPPIFPTNRTPRIDQRLGVCAVLKLISNSTEYLGTSFSSDYIQICEAHLMNGVSSHVSFGSTTDKKEFKQRVSRGGQSGHRTPRGRSKRKDIKRIAKRPPISIVKPLQSGGWVGVHLLEFFVHNLDLLRRHNRGFVKW